MKFHLTYTLLIKRGFKDKRITKKSLEIFILGQRFLSGKPQVILYKNVPYDKNQCSTVLYLKTPL